MGNVFFQGAEVYMSSGIVNGVFARVDRTQNVSASYQIPRNNVMVLGRFKPLADRPTTNYTPVSFSFEQMYSTKDVPRMLGILNSTGVGVQIGQNTQVTDWGARNYQIWDIPTMSDNYAGQWNVITGALKSFSLQASVGDFARCSVSVEAFDLQQAANNGARSYPGYSGNLVKPENISISGIDFNGLGFSGLMVESASFQLAYNHAQTFQLGTLYPERRVTDIMANLQLSAFMEGTTNTVPSLTGYNPGAPLTGSYYLTLTPSCGGDAPTTITMVNPYLDSQSITAQVGNYFQVSLSFSIPVSIVPGEATVGSNVIIL